LLPRTLLELSTRTEGERIIPHYLTERDHPWLRDLRGHCVHTHTATPAETGAGSGLGLS